MWFTHKVAKISIIEEQRALYERTIALLQEQLADARADAQRHCERADGALDHLIKLIGLPAVSRLGKIEAQQASDIVKHHAEKLSRQDMFEDLPFGDDDGTFKDKDQALLA